MFDIFQPWMWGAFTIFVIFALIVDLVMLKQNGTQAVDTRAALRWTLLWVGLALLFNALLWWYLDSTQGREIANQKSIEFLTGYLVEKSLAVDNIFVFLMIFTYFAVPPTYQKRVLIIGIIGAIILRAALILVGAWLLAQFHWILYVFGAFLVLTGIKMWWAAGKEPSLEDNPMLKFLRKLIKVSPNYDGENFFTMHNGVKMATPLLLVIILIGITDVIFAVDSIPAIFAITQDTFIVLTSNVFAILGLRAMYFLLADMANRFHLLSYGLALILVFIGTKMLLLDIYKIPVFAALGVVIGILTISIIASLKTKPSENTAKSK